MRYYAYLQQIGTGCDYTIGCGEHLTTIEANSDDEALEKIENLVSNNYHDDFELRRVLLFRASDVIPFNLKELYDRLSVEKENERTRLQHLRDMKDFERLKKKLGA